MVIGQKPSLVKGDENGVLRSYKLFRVRRTPSGYTGFEFRSRRLHRVAEKRTCASVIDRFPRTTEWSILFYRHDIRSTLVYRDVTENWYTNLLKSRPSEKHKTHRARCLSPITETAARYPKPGLRYMPCWVYLNDTTGNINIGTKNVKWSRKKQTWVSIDFFFYY